MSKDEVLISPWSDEVTEQWIKEQEKCSAVDVFEDYINGIITECECKSILTIIDNARNKE